MWDKLHSPEGRSLVRRLVEGQGASAINTSISPDDDMYRYLLDRVCDGDPDRAHLRYFETGKQMLEELRQVMDWAFGGFPSIPSFLDFACGHGRMTRYLVKELSPQRIWVSDVSPSAVDFQQREFGVHGFVSHLDPSRLGIDRDFSCIFSASFFSHLPERTFAAWLRRLFELLSEDGLLLFSVHDASLLAPGRRMGRRGIRFVRRSESRFLRKSNYGTTYVTESFVRAVIGKVAGPNAVVARLPRGLWEFQDLYAVSKDPHREPALLGLAPPPRGHLEVCEQSEDGVRFSGWSADLGRDETIREVQLVVNGQILQRGTPSIERPDVAEALGSARALCSGWTVDVPAAHLVPGDIVMIKSVNHEGRERILAIDTLEGLLARLSPERGHAPVPSSRAEERPGT